MVKKYGAISVLVFLFVGFALYSLNDLFFYTPDSARYVAWSQSLSNGTGFTDYTSPEATRYVVHSPLYPLFLSPVAGMFPGSIIALKFGNVLLAALTMLLLFGVVYRQGNRAVAVWAAVLYASHPLVIIFTTQILSEILFGLFFVLLLFLLSREDYDHAIRMNFLFLIAAVTGCVLSREIGLITIAVVTGYFIFRKQHTKAIIAFFVPVIVYLIWYLRNEIYYGNLESVNLKNSMLIVSNIYTSADAGFVTELWTRIISNSRYYLKELSIILFASPYNVFGNSYNVPWMLLVHQQEPLLKYTMAAIGTLKWILVPASIALVGVGMYSEVHRQKIWYVKYLFLVLFLGVILVYPVMDTRFLFPILLLFILWTASGLDFVMLHPSRTFRIGALCCVIVLLIPNSIWTSNFIVTQHNLHRDPLGTFMASPDTGITVNRRQIVEPMAADWLNRHCDSGEVVVYPRKELSLYLKNSKIIILKELTSLKSFNNTLRDYAVTYIVSGKDVTGWRDYEYQIGLNTTYSFDRVYENSAFEIYRVRPFTIEIKNTGRYAGVFENMRAGNDSIVNEYFKRNRVLVAGSPVAAYWTMVNKHAIGEVDSVRYYAHMLYTLPQGLLYARNISKHLTAVDRRTLTSTIWNPQQRSNLFLALGVDYWELDMDRKSLQFFRESLESDSSAALAYVYNIIVGYWMGDTTYAEIVSQKFSENFPNAELSLIMADLVRLYKILHSGTDLIKKSAILEHISDRYAQIGFYDFAIDNALHALRYDANRKSVYYKLGLIYDGIRKHYPALLVLQKGKHIDGGSAQIDSLLIIQNNKLYRN
jgi:tetratricopeptide (TPR) repeat protein/4-amino-4-deoxy-L-arabinose transferase-like glycosyltransferase